MSEQTVSNRSAERRFWISLVALIAISAMVRMLLIVHLRVRGSWDTQSYVVVANAIRSLDFHAGYDGRRTPVFPALMILCGMDFDNVRLAQSLLGIAIAAIVFAIVWRRTGNATTSFIAGLLSSVGIMELLYEQVVYSETLCTFWIVLSVWMYARIESQEILPMRDYVLLGIAAALAGMTRPMFLYLGPLYAALILIRRRRDIAALVLAPTLLLALGWSMVNARTIGYFGVTTTTGFNLSNHSGAFMELAPPRYSKIADIYLRYRDYQMEQMGSQTMTIWLAEGEMERKLGLTHAELSRQLTRMSLEMFARHPLLYLESLSRSWARFWGIGFYDFVRSYKQVVGGGFAYGTIVAMGTLQLAINAAFLAIAIYLFARWMMKHDRVGFDLAVIAIVLMGSVVQAFMEYGENVRYLAPLAPLTIYLVATAITRARDIANES
ncbi:MAG TPA: hypothetical protein VMT64_12745 [Candidatus Binataceae bacterium]|nr:hypothetical protein [Candidatus Binataceae bacterium]